MDAPRSTAIDCLATRRALRTHWLSVAVQALLCSLLVAAFGALRAWPSIWGLYILAPTGVWVICLGLANLVRAVSVSRTLRRYPWRRLTGWYHFEWLMYSSYWPLPPRSSISMLRVVDDAGVDTFFRVTPLRGGSSRPLGPLEGGEVWLAIGPADRRGVGALPPGAPLFRVTASPRFRSQS